MKRFLCLSMLVTASLASATPSEADAKAVLEKALIKPLMAKELKNSRFSRAYQPPQTRRVRITDEVARTDSKGAAFMTFAVDAKHGWVVVADDEPEAVKEEQAWRKDTITGCVYPESGEVFVKRSGKLYGAGILLGKKSTAGAADDFVCQPAGDGKVASAK